MKILLLSNYENNRQQSMQRFADMLCVGLSAAGHQVRVVRPPVWLGRLHRSEAGLGKWIGYLDRFLLYPPLLRRQMRWADVVHICDQANAVYIPRLHGKSHVVTCHDMLAIRAAQGEIPESPTGWTGRIFQRWILRSLRQAQYVVCVSEQTRRELQRIARLPDTQLAVVPNALNYPYRPMPPAEANKHLHVLALADERPFFVHVGGNQWYKNRLGAVRIFAELAGLPHYERHVLVMAGKLWTDELRELVVKLGMRDRVLERVEVSNEQLRALYSSAEALLFPSLAEGFGWPIAEAQACGCPVVTTNKAPMTDVGGDAAIYIDPADPAGAAAAVAKALQHRDAYCRASLENAARFSIHAMIDGYLRSYLVVASN